MNRLLLLASSFLLFVSTTAIAQESVCFSCHEDVTKDWKTSIHAKNGISCHNCHGGNPKDAENAMDPKAGFVGKPSSPEAVPDFCGKCHVGVKENYIKSRHYRAIEGGGPSPSQSGSGHAGGPSCVTCHTAHKQKKADISLISPEHCASCHSFDRAEKIRNAMIYTETEITNLDKRIGSLQAQEYDIDSIKKTLFATRNQFHRLTHVLDVDLILKETGALQKDLSHLKEDISKSEKIEAGRKIYGGLIVVFFLLGAIIFWWYRNTTLSD